MSVRTGAKRRRVLLLHAGVLATLMVRHPCKLNAGHRVGVLRVRMSVGAFLAKRTARF